MQHHKTYACMQHYFSVVSYEKYSTMIDSTSDEVEV